MVLFLHSLAALKPDSQGKRFTGFNDSLLLVRPKIERPVYSLASTRKGHVEVRNERLLMGNELGNL